MAKKSASRTKKKKTAAKKPASKKSASRKPATKKSTPKRSTSKNASQKSDGARKKTAAKRTTPKNTAASRKSSSRKAASRSTSKKSSKKSQKSQTSLFKKLFGFYGILLFFLIVAGLAISSYFWFHTAESESVGRQASTGQAEVPIKTKEFDKIGGAVSPPAPPKDVPAPEGPKQASDPILDQEPKPAPTLTDNRPKVAIIIDDMGRSKDMAEKFFNLDTPFTYSILPYARYQREIAQSAVQRGYQVMLHLPMEPNEYPAIDPGPGALLTSMTPDERIKQLKINLEAVPYIEGVNNHMGSKMTAMFPQMNQVFTVLKKRGLFFIDSRTTAATQCRSSARMFKLPFAERDVFLDHVQSRQAIAKRIEELINIAEINGSAIGIGHPHQITYEVLREKLAEMKKRVQLVSASALVH